MSRLKELYKKEIISKMKKDFNFKNDLEVPKIEKIVVNVGAGFASADPKSLEEVAQSLTKITGQRPIYTKAKRAISAFKIKKGQKIGLKVTLRRDRMYDFLDKIINITLPRVRDFKGVPNSFDGHGNLTIGFKEHTAFPETGDEVKTFGLEVTICTNSKKDEYAKRLLEYFGLPFRK